MKEWKNCHFCKGVNPWYWSKNGHFSNFFFLGNSGQKNVFYDILERKNAFQGYKNKKFKKWKNRHISKGFNPWFWSKSGNFSNFFFLGNIGQKNVFYNILEGRNAFLGYKNKKIKRSKNCHFFLKGLSHGFCPKIAIFPTFFSEEILARKMSFMIFYSEKTPFKAIKTRSSKSRKIVIFPKGLTHGFGPKMAIFSTFFFRQYRPEKCLLRYSRVEKRLSSL